jgi:murein L,D-transpeptidase YcbB/YkuD
LIEAGKLDEVRWPDCSSYRIQVEQFYRSLRFELAWVQQRYPTQQANVMIELFQTAEKKGLEPEDYDASLWSARLDAFATSSTNSDELARFDFALTVSSLRYVSDLYQGKVSSRECQVNLPEKDFEVAQFLRNEVIHASNVSAAFQKLEPAYEATGEHS